MLGLLSKGKKNKKGSFRDKLNKFMEYTNEINKSKYFAGVVMIMLNIGSKYITIKLSKSQEAYLGSSIARQLLIFSIIWMGTRDLVIALIMSAVFVILTDHLFNEKSSYCVLPKALREYEDLIDENKDGVISKEEIEKAKNLLEKAQKNEKYKNHLRQVEDFSNKL
tara:strand:- start:2267 stop:2764 length:498 start_codon:yes stop_codon:yes gene_type:complete